MAETLEQRRAKDAWDRAKAAAATAYGKDYSNLAKGLPALIMISGLMQVLAFLHHKGGGKEQRQHAALETDLRTWLQQRFPEVLKSPEVPKKGETKPSPNQLFVEFMDCLVKAPPQVYQEITAEAHAWLRWLRQMASAAVGDVP